MGRQAKIRKNKMTCLATDVTGSIAQRANFKFLNDLNFCNVLKQ